MTATLLQEWYEFSPLAEFNEKDMAAIFRAIKLTLHNEAWANLDEGTRKHFIVKNRNGSEYRYGNSPKIRKPLNPRPEK